jgi:hypothetical protein
MDIWTARTDALRYLETEHPDGLAALSNSFDLIDRCVDVYELRAGKDVYARICGLTLLKGKHLAVGAYSLILDGLAQESGALLRPLIEYGELLTYFRTFPEKAERAAENDLPKAGERAKAIGGMFKDFREHLNSHASHSSYSAHSLSHLVERDTFRFKKLQRAVPKVLDENLKSIATQIFFLAREGVLSLQQLSSEDFLVLAKAGDDLREEIVRVFDLPAA